MRGGASDTVFSVGRQVAEIGEGVGGISRQDSGVMKGGIGILKESIKTATNLVFFDMLILEDSPTCTVYLSSVPP